MIKKVTEGLKNSMETAIQFQTKNLIEKDNFNKIVRKYRIFRIKKHKEKLKKKKYLMHLI
jgi:hypothetical protein